MSLTFHFFFSFFFFQEKQREIKGLCKKLEEAERSLKEVEDKFV